MACYKSTQRGLEKGTHKPTSLGLSTYRAKFTRVLAVSCYTIIWGTLPSTNIQSVC